MRLISLNLDDITLGKPLPGAIYDVSGDVVLKTGYIPTTAQEVKFLLEGNLQRDLDEINNKPEKRDVAASSDKSEKQDVAASSDKSEKQDVATSSNKSEKQDVAASSDKSEKQDVVPSSNKSEKQDVAPSSNKSEKQDAATSQEAANSLPLDQIKLNIGDSIQLQVQVQSKTASPRYYVTLVGYLVGESVIVTTPILNGKILLIREGQSFVARLFTGNNAYAFTTLAKKVTNSPFPHLHLTYPKEVRGVVVRSSSRAQANIICHATVKGGKGIACVALDISIGGVLLAAKEQIGATGEKLVLKLRVIVSEVEHLLTLQCLIRSVNIVALAGDATPSVQHGVSFEKISGQDALVITALLYHVAKDTDDG